MAQKVFIAKILGLNLFYDLGFVMTGHRICLNVLP